jgi:hypothetical protein
VIAVAVTVTPVRGFPPIVAVVLEMKFVPAIVTAVPPATGPVVGEMLEMTGPETPPPWPPPPPPLHPTRSVDATIT